MGLFVLFVRGHNLLFYCLYGKSDENSTSSRGHIESHGLDHSTHFGRAYTEHKRLFFNTQRKGERASMEMRVRAGDAAKFALALSEVMTLGWDERRWKWEVSVGVEW